MEFDIFGTCVSRDPFELESNTHKVNVYFSRSSLVSVVQPPLNFKKYDIQLESNFIRRSLQYDFTKRFKNYVENPRSEVIIIDLIQERYPLTQIEHSLVTFSPDYRKAKLPVGNQIQKFDHLILFEDNINEICFLLKNYKYVILHEASLSTKYYDENGNEVDQMLFKKDKYFLEYGDIYYKILKEKLENVYSLKINGFIGDGDHKWGVAPSHFERGYYEKFNEGLDYIINNKTDYTYTNSTRMEN